MDPELDGRQNELNPKDQESEEGFNVLIPVVIVGLVFGVIILIVNLTNKNSAPAESAAASASAGPATASGQVAGTKVVYGPNLPKEKASPIPDKVSSTSPSPSPSPTPSSNTSDEPSPEPSPSPTEQPTPSPEETPFPTP